MNIKRLIYCHLLIAILLITFLYPPTKAIWDVIDRAFFHFLNSPMEGRPWLQYFWAFSNHKNADWVEDAIFLVLSIVYIAAPSSKTRTRRVAEILFVLVFIALIILFVNRIFFREQVRILRDSPTLIIESCVRLSYEIPWLSIKDTSAKSFPADHATTALLFAFCYTFLARNWISVLTCLYCAYLTLPRMATGAHWLSDMLVGSGTILLFFLSWAYCLPVQQTVVECLDRFFCFFRKKKVDSEV